MGSPLDYHDTVELLNAGENTAPAEPQQLQLEAVPITVVCNDKTQTHIKANAESWGWDPRGVVVIDGRWSYADHDEDCMIPYHTIHHITYHFDELQTGTDTSN